MRKTLELIFSFQTLTIILLLLIVYIMIRPKIYLTSTKLEQNNQCQKEEPYPNPKRLEEENAWKEKCIMDRKRQGDKFPDLDCLSESWKVEFQEPKTLMHKVESSCPTTIGYRKTIFLKLFVTQSVITSLFSYNKMF